MKKIIFLDTELYNSTLCLGSHHYARLFKDNGWEVMWLSQSISPFSFLNTKNRKEYIEAYHNGIKKNSDDIYNYTPFSLLPYLKLMILDNLWFAKHSLNFTLPSLKNILFKAGFSTVDVLFVNNIKLISIIDLIEIKDQIITRISDNFSGFSHNPANILELEKFVVKKSDSVFCTTNNLLEKIKFINKNSHLLPNGVDYQKFAGFHDEPDELKKIPGKKVIYVGTISNWFDFELLASASEEMQDLSFVIIGPIYTKDVDIFNKNKYRNIYYLGPRNYDLIPNYLSNCDCGIIPFKVNKLTNDVSPIKMFEYFAAGLPIVSSGISQVKPFSEAVYIYNNKNEFTKCIRKSIEESKDKKEYYFKIARENSWETRFEKIISLINLYSK